MRFSIIYIFDLIFETVVGVFNVFGKEQQIVGMRDIPSYTPNIIQ